VKLQFKKAGQWAGIASVVAFFIFCAIRASHLRHIAASHSPIVATDQLQPTKKATKTPNTLLPDILSGLTVGVKIKPDLPSDMPKPDSHIVSLARDLQGNVWIGTEDDGVYRYDPDADPDSQWSQFTTNNGLGDNNAYSIACDQQGRIWVGELNHGVAVFNGDTWKNYDVLDGPIGERIFKIAVCPTDGDVWMATSAGLTRYSPDTDTWRNYTRADGLPSDQANGLAFDTKGNIYVGTQCDGIAIGSAVGGYKQWHTIPGPDQLPTTPVGSGLPSGLINDLLVTSDEKIYAATSAGLAFSTNSGSSWEYIRGSDYAAKVRRFVGDAPPDDWQPMSQINVKDLLLPEDYITCLAEDADTNIWLGFRTEGYAVLNSKADKILFHDTHRGGWLSDDYVTTMLPGDNFKRYVGSYGGGLAIPDLSTNDDVAQDSVQTNHATITATLPRSAKPPSLEEFNSYLKEINSVPYSREDATPMVIPLEDDWKTEGEWIGRYGRFWIVLCANWSQRFTGHNLEMNDLWGAGWDVTYDARMGLNHNPGDSLRYWLTALATADPRSLEMSPTFLHSRVMKNLTTWDVDRRQSEWDDHGEAYPRTQDGPHIYCSLNIPPGLFYLSLYDVNNDGHLGVNRFRDYEISIRPHPGRSSLDIITPKYSIMRSFYDIVDFNKKPELAHARIDNFWGGVYKRFLVRGPTTLTIQVNRNYSFNTLLNGVMLDLVDELPPPYYQTKQDWQQKQAQQAKERGQISGQPQSSPDDFKPAATEAEAAGRMFEELQQLPLKNETWWAVNKRRFYLPLLRWYLKNNVGSEPSQFTETSPLATCYYQLGLYPQWEESLKTLGIVPARAIEKSLRWDGVTYSYAGKGYEVVTNYLVTHPIRRDASKTSTPVISKDLRATNGVPQIKSK
jgi:sugar lactone lactonase YvrE